MKAGAVVFPMANPVPEITPDEALAAGAAVVAVSYTHLDVYKRQMYPS